MNNIIQSLNRYPVEDGMEHPVENEISKVLEEEPHEFYAWMRDILDQEIHHPTADILKCLGRVIEGKSDKCQIIAHDLGRRGLEHPDAGVRDSSIQLLEDLGTQTALETLERHDEKTEWLKTYLEKVIKDWEA